MVWCRMVVPLRTTGMFVCYVPTIPPWVFSKCAVAISASSRMCDHRSTLIRSFLISSASLLWWYTTIPYQTRPYHHQTHPPSFPFLHFAMTTMNLPRLILLLLVFFLVAKDGRAFVIPSLAPMPTPHTTTTLGVRNIDLPECLIFYGDKVLDEEDAGLKSLLQECRETDTALIAICQPEEHETNRNVPAFADLSFVAPTRQAPNPKDLWQAIQSTIIQPRPFGGSAGFGAKLPDPERPPMPARTVVFCKTLDETRAARFCGMRVISLEDNDLADAVVNSFDFYLDDIATPGSFWLNPPHPRDDDGNKVYVEDLIEEMEVALNDKMQNASKDTRKQNTKEDDMDDDELQRILADMAPLR